MFTFYRPRLASIYETRRWMNLMHEDSGVETGGSGASMNRGIRAPGAPLGTKILRKKIRGVYLQLNRIATNLVSTAHTGLFSFLFPEQLMTQSDCDFQLQDQVMQELSSCWDGRPFGHNRRGPKSGGYCAHFPGGLGPHLTQCGLGRGLPLCQVAFWSM